jgi:hypothetical protein
MATMVALDRYAKSDFVDFGHSEVVLPVAADVCVTAPFAANSISSLHANNISNLKREPNFKLMIAKGLTNGDHLLSGKSKSEWRRLTRRFEDAGGAFRPIRNFAAAEVAALYSGLFEKRWGFSPTGKDLLPTVLRELKDMLHGDVLFIKDRPVGIELMYKNETPRWLFANGVNRGLDPEFRDYSLGGILNFRNIVGLEQEASTNKKRLRYSFGRNDAPYKALWSFENCAYYLA